MNTLINYEITDGILEITLDDSRNYNAFSKDLIIHFINILESSKNKDEIRMLILKAAGKHFSAGANQKSMQNITNASNEKNLEEELILHNFL